MRLAPPLIALGGRLRSGKDVVADWLVEKHGFVKIGMSDALHEAMLAIDPIIDEHAVAADEGVLVHRIHYSEAIASEGYVEAKKRPEVRRLLQNLGTEVGRDMIGENVWVNIMARKIDDHRGAGHPVVVTGIRFPNEVQMVRDLAGTAVWIERPGEHAPTSTAAAHPSETSVQSSDFDDVIVNDGSLGELQAKASELV
ncbi:hypothetical protein [Streptomyces sp. AC495_CC817]|uniref:deoxynucleotide monophosphate kinase family protein n=1 Tax=Streptomyces sp. AC495_CC817 TaxID=2823900 RepID=UPI001C252336|nr:hypothetical protein [Streptomyces sp. AC495_CC817]